MRNAARSRKATRAPGRRPLAYASTIVATPSTIASTLRTCNNTIKRGTTAHLGRRVRLSPAGAASRASAGAAAAARSRGTGLY